jgi:hypothetical protein
MLSRASELGPFASPVPLRIRSGTVAWIGASSFEARSVGSLGVMQRTGILVPRALRIDYSTRTSADDDASRLREQYRAVQDTLLAQLRCEMVETVGVGLKSGSELNRSIEHFILAGERDQAVVTSRAPYLTPSTT